MSLYLQKGKAAEISPEKARSSARKGAKAAQRAAQKAAPGECLIRANRSYLYAELTPASHIPLSSWS